MPYHRKHADVISHRRTSSLPPALQRDLVHFADAFDGACGEAADGRLRASPERIHRCSAQIGDLALEAVAAIDQDMRRAMDAGWRRRGRPHWRLGTARLDDPSQTAAWWLGVCHPDGRVREQALRWLAERRIPPESALALALAVYRANDWAAPVRAAGERYLRAVITLTAPAIIADVLVTLAPQLAQLERWRRPGADAHPLADQLTEQLSVAAVAQEVARLFITRQRGPLGATLRHLLRQPYLDAHLPALVHGAALPDVRAAALRALLTGKVHWLGPATLVGDPLRPWASKRYVSTRMARAVTSAVLPVPAALWRCGAADRSGQVRATVLQAAIEMPDRFPVGLDAATLAGALAGDRSQRVRERADFILRN